MTATTQVRWLSCESRDVPADDWWLDPGEAAVQATLRVAKRRADWRLGRWTAKRLVARWLGEPDASPGEPTRIAILAAADGVPEAWLDGAPAPVALSVSHRADRALCAVAAPGVALGCDVELVEERSVAFVRDWLAPEEQRCVATAPGGDRARLANLIWAAKEAAAKARREGLRLDVRRCVVDLVDVEPVEGWRPFVVGDEGVVIDGWWRDAGGFVLAVAASPAPDVPAECGRVSATPA